MPPAHNKEPVWFKPRDSDEDKICYYVREGRKNRHQYAIGSAHPRADTEGSEFYDMIFLYREPHDDTGDFVKDWYGPRSLVDEVIQVNTAGNTRTSAILYPRSTTPPTEDQRVDVFGEMTLEDEDFTASWPVADDDILQLALVSGSFNGDEVYLTFSDDTIDVIGNGRYTIVRHINSTTVQIAVTYDASATIAGTINACAFEACYILDGYSDSEDAPGVLANKFHVRRFTYRLAEKTVSQPWDSSLGLRVYTKTQFVPQTWAKNQDGTTAADADDNFATSFSVVSKDIAQRQHQEVTDSPDQDGLEWTGFMKIRIPAILRGFSIPLAWARAVKGDYLSYDDDYSISQDTIGPLEQSVATRTLRRVVLEADVGSTISSVAPGGIFAFQPESFPVNIGSWRAYVGSNVWTRARVRTASLGPFLLGSTPMAATVPTGGHTSGTGASSGANGDGDTVTLTGSLPPWGTEVVWDINPQKARWGYWIIDFLFVTLPANPA